MTRTVCLFARLSLLSLSLSWWAGCATARFGPPTAPLRVTCDVSDASVWIDDHLVAQVSAFARGDKRLPVGFHRLEIRAPGYYSYFQELEVKADTPVVLQAPLHPLLD